MRLVKEIYKGISWGCTIMVLLGIIFTIAGQSPFVGDSYIRQAICAMMVGIGFSVPSIVYENDKLSLGMQTFIHMGTGLTIYFPVAFYAGWIPINMGIGVVIGTVISMFSVAFLVWLCFYQYNKRQCRNINKAIDDKASH